MSCVQRIRPAVTTKLYLGRSPATSAPTTSTSIHHTTHIFNLPSDVLHDIFKDALSINNFSRIRDISVIRHNIMLVCRYFHSVIIESPSLWSLIPLAGPQPNFIAAGKMLEFSKDAPLHFHLDLRIEDQENWCDSDMMEKIFGSWVIPRLSQIQRLVFIVDDMDITEGIYSLLSSTPAPILEEFKLVFGTLDLGDSRLLSIQDSPSDLGNAATVFNRKYPRLRSLTIHAAPFEFASFNTKTITHIDLSHQKAIHPALFIGMISSTPNLQSLTLRNSGPAFERRNKLSPTVSLPHLRNMVLGSMDSIYIDYLLSILRSLDLRKLGIHSVPEPEAEAIWTSLLLYHQKTQCFAKLETLELFDVEGSPKMADGQQNSYQMLLSSLTHLSQLRMRRITARYIDILNPSEYDPPVHVPSLRVLEISSVIESMSDSGGSDTRDREPLPTKEVASSIVSLFRSRVPKPGQAKEWEWKATNLHLDGDEWNLNEDRKEKLMESLMQLGPMAPILAWDARAPFFNDYYDSEEI